MAKPGYLSTSLGSGHCFYTVALEILGCLLFAFCERIKQTQTCEACGSFLDPDISINSCHSLLVTRSTYFQFCNYNDFLGEPNIRVSGQNGCTVIFPREMWVNVCSPEIGHQQCVTETSPPKSSPVKHGIYSPWFLGEVLFFGSMHHCWLYPSWVTIQ